jgi:hypothetical protein
MWTIGNYFKPAYLFNEMLGHLVDDRFLVYELQKHRARWKCAVLNLVNVIGLIFIVAGQHCWQHPEKPHVKTSTMILQIQVEIGDENARCLGGGRKGAKPAIEAHKQTCNAAGIISIDHNNHR